MHRQWHLGTANSMIYFRIHLVMGKGPKFFLVELLATLGISYYRTDGTASVVVSHDLYLNLFIQNELLLNDIFNRTSTRFGDWWGRRFDSIGIHQLPHHQQRRRIVLVWFLQVFFWPTKKEKKLSKENLELTGTGGNRFSGSGSGPISPSCIFTFLFYNASSSSFLSSPFLLCLEN